MDDPKQSGSKAIHVISGKRGEERVRSRILEEQVQAAVQRELGLADRPRPADDLGQGATLLLGGGGGAVARRTFTSSSLSLVPRPDDRPFKPVAQHELVHGHDI